MLVSDIQQSDSVTGVYTCVYILCIHTYIHNCIKIYINSFLGSFSLQVITKCSVKFLVL